MFGHVMYCLTMHENIISLVKSLSVGGCSCYHANGRGSMGGYDPATGHYVPGTYDPGPKTECMRCRARGCLEADGVEYEKDDRVFYTSYNMGLGGATACKTFEGDVYVGTFTGSLGLAGIANH